jgi:hypothetical protein
MRCTLVCALTSIALFATLPCVAAGVIHSSDLTIVTDFQGPHSARSIQVMEEETDRILKDTGLHLEWRSRNDVAGGVFSDLVLVQFKGTCILKPAPYLYDEMGPPLAFTYTTDGAVQPFSEVSCDQISAFVRSGLHAEDYKKADVLMGRALGRVVAHELVHMLTGSGKHGHNGVFERALTVDQLVYGKLPLSPGDLKRVRAER